MQVKEQPENFLKGWLWNRTEFRPDGTLHACDSRRIFCSSGIRNGVFLYTEGDITKLVNAPLCKNCINKMNKFGYDFNNGKWNIIRCQNQ